MRNRLILANALLALLGMTTPTNTQALVPGEFVEFDSGWGEANQVRLIGYLARPPGPGPFPAAVILHGGSGFHSDMLSWADRMRAWGYVALAVDSFGRRGSTLGFTDQPADAFRALQFLKNQPFVRGDDVAVMGFSLGGDSVVTALERRSVTGLLFPDKFRAGVAFSPQCTGASGIMTAPTLVLVGELDGARASACQAMVDGISDTGHSRTPGDRSKVELVIYPGARHGFTAQDLRFSSGIEVLGSQVEYNDAATRDSIERVRSFLGRNLSQQ
jgi:dienelactone hydrolase